MSGGWEPANGGGDPHAQLARCRRLLDRVQAATQTGLWHYNPATGEVTGSARVFEIFGVDPPPGPISVETALAAYHPDDRPRMRAALAECSRNGTPYALEVRVVRPTGEMRIIKAWGDTEPAGKGGARLLYGICQDLTDERRSMQERARTDERLALVIKASRDGVWDWSEDSDQVYFSDRFAEILGLAGSTNTMPVATARSLIHPDDAAAFSELIDRHLGGQAHWDTELRLRRPDGSYRWVEIKALAAPRPPGEPRRIVGTVGDIEERKQAERSLRKARAEAMAASRAKSDFVAMVNHELRTSLNGIIGILELMSREDLTQTQREHLDTASEGARSLLAIINDLLDLSKLDADRITLRAVAFCPRKLVRGVADLFSPLAAGRGLSLAVNVADDVPEHLVSDPARLRQVIANLVGNAIKFTKQGGIVVAVRHLPASGNMGMLRIEVRDTGAGIPQEDQGRLFEPYSQVRGSGDPGSTGLGLAICKRLTEAMGGAIGVDSAAGQGSTFWFTVETRTASEGPETDIPREPDPAVAHIATVARPDTGGRASRGGPGQDRPATAHLLVAEDNEINRRVISAMLINLGYSFELVTDGRQAVAAARRGGFDAILMDVQMPEIDGVMATRLIREEECERGGCIPIIAITAHALEGSAREFLDAGMTGVVPKPIAVARLAAELAKALADRIVAAPGATA